jgi:phenylpropionate dioxygenase-like ring-hydroxylating dioxygenase large terminal subunit
MEQALSASHPRSDSTAALAADANTAAWRPGEFALRDAWFPVAHTPTLGTHPLLRMVHSQPIYLWREGDRIRATEYHPVHASEGERTPFTGGTGDYPVIDRYGHLWVWYGNPLNADPALLPDIPFLPPRRAQPRFAWGLNFFHCPYELVLENILDLTHIDFVHGAYAGAAESQEDSIRFESTSETVTMIRTVKKRPVSKYQREVLGVTEKYQDQTAFTHVFIRSGVCFLHSHYSAAPSIPLMQSNTPESKTLTRANYVFGIQQTTHKGYARMWPQTASIIASQDESVLNPQAPRYVGRPARRDCSTRFDAAGLHYRGRHNALIERQKRGDFAYLPDISEGSDLAEILHVERLK